MENATSNYLAEVTNEIVAGLQISLTIVIMFGNGLVLVAVVKYIRKATSSCVLIVNLAIADLLMGLILPVQAFSRLYMPFASSKYSCFVRMSTMVLSSFSSMFAVLLMAVDRYLGVCHCVLYHRNVSIRKTMFAVVTMWIYSIFFALYPIHYFINTSLSSCVVKQIVSPQYLLLIPVQYFIILLSIGLIYFNICKVALNRRRVISVDLGFVLTSRVVRLRRELRTAKLMAAILIVFFFCWTPFAVVWVYDLNKETTNGTVAILADASIFLGIINSAVNPIIYPLQNRDFKKAFREIVGCKNKAP